MERADAERAHRQPRDAFRKKHVLESRRPHFIDEPPGQQQANIAPSEPAEGEGKRARRRWVEPLDIINGDHHWLALAEKLKHVAHRDRERALIDGIS